jgi:uncharacterized protein (DUF427 family)
VRDDLLRPSDTHTRCAYKGLASYHSIETHAGVEEDLVWTYPSPEREAEKVTDLLCFFNERVDIDVDGLRLARPETQWSSRARSGASR